MSTIHAHVPTCSPEELRLSINKLSYQINPIALTVKLLTCPELSSNAKIYWQYLYSQSDYFAHTVIYNQSRIAIRFNVHTKTVKRAIDMLLRNGWLKITKHAPHGGVSEFQVCMPQEVLDEIIQGEYRKEGPLNYENRERHYCKDICGKIMFSYYINPNGSKTIILSEELDIYKVASVLQRSITNSVAANETFDVKSNEIFTDMLEREQSSVVALSDNDIIPVEYEHSINETARDLDRKIMSLELTGSEKYNLTKKRNSLLNKIDDLKRLHAHPILAKLFCQFDKKIMTENLPKEEKHELSNKQANLISLLSKIENRVDSSVPIPIIKLNKKITIKNTLFSNSVNPISKKNTRYFANVKESGNYTPIRYRDINPLQVPQQYIEKLKQAIQTHRAKISDPLGLFDEIIWAISRQFVGKPKDRPNATFSDIMRFNTCAAIKLIRQGVWTMPAGFKPLEVITAERKAERAKDVALRSNSHVDTISEAMSIKAMLEKSGRL